MRKIMSDDKVNEVDSTSNDLDSKTLFVRLIPYEATSEEFSEYFSQFVPVKHAVVVKDNEGKSRGFGFVSFVSDDDALTALVESRKSKFKGRFLRVDVAKRRDRKENVEKEVRVKVEKRRARLIVRNIPWSLKDAEELKKLFSKYGAVFDAYIPKKKGGQMLGFAFVVMKKQSAADKAVKDSVGLEIHGREVAVDFAVQKSKWEEMMDDQDKDNGSIENVEDNNVDREDKDEESDEDEREDEGEDGDEAEEEGEEEDDEDDEEEDEDDLHKDEIVLEDISGGSDSEEESEVEKRAPKNRQDPYSIFVRNLPYDADSERLKEHFSRFGKVRYALPVIDKETGLAKGTAFVSFMEEEAYQKCLENAPEIKSTSLLTSDDVSTNYVFDGRILSVASTVDRSSAEKLHERNLGQRKEAFGVSRDDREKRNLYLLNEGTITSNSKLAKYLSSAELEMRDKSYKLRVDQLKRNPSLHISLTRLAIRNLPRSMNPKALKALGRKAVVQFATEVKGEKRQPLSKEEIKRSIKLKHDLDPLKSDKSKNKGVVKQAKVVEEVKGTGEAGRSRGYGFIEFRDHKSALMGLRWLNAHEVTSEEILEGFPEEKRKEMQSFPNKKRRLIAEFAIENANVVKRRRDKMMQNRTKTENSKKRKEEGISDEKEERPNKKAKFTKNLKLNKKFNHKLKGKSEAPESKPKVSDKSGLSDDVKHIIGIKRKRRKNKS